jgi:predicted MPP superfamily phosphohydrolase
VGAVALAGLAWGWYEAGWVRLRTLEIELPALPPELNGVRIVHLSDFHLGLPSRGARAVARGVAWAGDRDADLVCITGDLVSRPRGEAKLRELVRTLPRCYAILGNHDLAISRDPFSKAVGLRGLEPARLLLDEGVEVEVRGERVWIAGLDPRSRGGEPRLHQDASLTVLLSHFPSVLDRPAAEGFDLVLAGHMHDGQICVPYPGGKLRLAHPSAPYTHGLYRRSGTVMHVTPGLGTTFVPFRFFARPEATELVLRAPVRSGLTQLDGGQSQ